MTISMNRPRELNGGYDLRTSHRLVTFTGSVTLLSARTATAGHFFAFRWASTTSAKCFIKYVGAKFTLTTAYGTAQETGCDMILARTYTAAHTGGTSVDVGSTVVDTNQLMAGFGVSLIGSAQVKVATTGDLTAGTQTLDANPIGVLSDWSSAIGITVPTATSGARSGFGTLFSCEESTHKAPIVLTTDEGFVLRSVNLMGATGVGRWDICVEWDEGTPH